MIKLFEEFFDDVDIEEVSVDDGLNLDTEYNHSMDVMICPFYLSTDCEVNDNKFSLFFKKLNAYCENCVSFDEFKIELNYEYKDATGKQITGTVDSDFVDIVQQYNKSHSEGRCNFIVSIKFIENKSCSFDNFKKDLNAIFKLFYRLCIDHYYVEETFISFEFI